MSINDWRVSPSHLGDRQRLLFGIWLEILVSKTSSLTRSFGSLHNSLYQCSTGVIRLSLRTAHCILCCWLLQWDSGSQWTIEYQKSEVVFRETKWFLWVCVLTTYVLLILFLYIRWQAVWICLQYEWTMIFELTAFLYKI